MLNDGERQVSPTLSGIRADHVARYQFACSEIGSGKRVIDIACGVGYGAKLLAEAGNKVTAVDRDIETIEYAREHYAHPNINFVHEDASSPGQDWGDHDVAVCFETLEHLSDPAILLRSLKCPLLIASVPNEDGFPFQTYYEFHFRHYSLNEFDSLLRSCRFDPLGFYAQENDLSGVGPYVIGRTIIVKAKKEAKLTAPKHVTILGLGPSLEQYVDVTKKQGNRRALCDEVWGINAVGDVIMCDRVFHMDDVRIQEIRAAARPRSNIAQMLEWMKKHSGPIYTSRLHPDYPGLVAFPLEQVINHLGYPYFNNTAAYAVAYAIHIGVEAISLFGIDFTWPNGHEAERGRGCVEFWLGYAHARGIQIYPSGNSSLLDGLVPEAERLYGYDTLDVEIREVGGVVTVETKPKGTLPTAAEIEDRYNHDKHPNHIVQAEREKAAPVDHLALEYAGC